MECSDLLLFIRNHTALLLCTDSDFYKCSADILLLQIHSSILRRKDRSLIQKIFQIGSGKSCRCSCDLFQIHIIPERFALGMNLKDCLLYTSRGGTL